MHYDNICSLLKKGSVDTFLLKGKFIFIVKTTCAVTVSFIIQSIEIFKIYQQIL